MRVLDNFSCSVLFASIPQHFAPRYARAVQERPDYRRLMPAARPAHDRISLADACAVVARIGDAENVTPTANPRRRRTRHEPRRIRDADVRLHAARIDRIRG